jgi:hypothetical protein
LKEVNLNSSKGIFVLSSVALGGCGGRMVDVDDEAAAVEVGAKENPPEEEVNDGRGVCCCAGVVDCCEDCGEKVNVGADVGNEGVAGVADTCA